MPGDSVSHFWNWSAASAQRCSRKHSAACPQISVCAAFDSTDNTNMAAMDLNLHTPKLFYGLGHNHDPVSLDVFQQLARAAWPADFDLTDRVGATDPEVQALVA